MRACGIGKRAVAVLCGAVVSLALASEVEAANYTITVDAYVYAWPAKTWDFLREFCSVAIVAGVPSHCIEGGGGVGSIRLLADGTEQQLLARGELSYTYEAITGPDAAVGYQATIEVLPVDEPLHSRIVATATWNELALDAANREGARDSYRQHLQIVVNDAKVAAEAS